MSDRWQLDWLVLTVVKVDQSVSRRQAICHAARAGAVLLTLLRSFIKRDGSACTHTHTHTYTHI